MSHPLDLFCSILGVTHEVYFSLSEDHILCGISDLGIC